MPRLYSSPSQVLLTLLQSAFVLIELLFNTTKISKDLHPAQTTGAFSFSFCWDLIVI